MKFLKTFFITIFVLILLVGVGLFIFLKNFDINKYREQIAAEMSKQIGRNVSIGHLGLNASLANGVYAQVQGLNVSEHPDFGQGDFASIGAVQLNVDVMAYLKRREILISKVLVEGLDIRIIRQASGEINVPGLPGQGQKVSPPSPLPSPSSTQTQTVTSSPSASSGQAGGALANFSIKTITISNGTVLFVDQSQTPPLQISISKIDLIVKKFSLTNPFSFEGRAALFASEQNVSIQGQSSVNVPAPLPGEPTRQGGPIGQEAQLSSVQVEMDLSKINVSDLLKAIPSLEPAGLKDNLDGKIAIQIPSLTVGAKGLTGLALTGKLEGGKVFLKTVPVPIEKITADFTADAKDIDVSAFSLQLSTGIVKGTAKITDYLQRQELTLQVQASAIPLASFVANLPEVPEVPEGVKLTGGVNGDANITGQNLSNPDIFLNSLNGNGKFEVNDGKIENFNVLKMVLSRIPFMSGLEEVAAANMPEKYRAEFNSNETIFQKIGSNLQITNGTVSLPDMQVLSNLFEANMNITADPKLNGKISGEVKLPADLSDFLGTKVPPLAYLKNSEGRLVIPLATYEGPLAGLKIMPNVASLGTDAAVGEGRNQIDKLLDKVFKTEETPANEGTGTPAQKPPERELIDQVLDKIFR